MDKTRVLDITNTTLEHIYPQKLEPNNQNSDLEPVKHTLGNLTILGPGENNTTGNKGFSEKRKAFEKSNLRINREIANSTEWTPTLVEKRTEALAKMAMKIFIP